MGLGYLLKGKVLFNIGYQLTGLDQCRKLTQYTTTGLDKDEGGTRIVTFCLVFIWLLHHRNQQATRSEQLPGLGLNFAADGIKYQINWINLLPEGRRFIVDRLIRTKLFE